MNCIAVAPGRTSPEGADAHAHRHHSGVVHAAHRPSHDEGGDGDRDRRLDVERRPQGRGRRDHGDHDGEPDEHRVVVHVAVQPQRGHAQVVHARDAEPGGEPAEDEGAAAVAAVADGEDARADDDHGDEQAEDGQRHVVADVRTADAEAEHRHEVHRPDAGADRGGRGEEPVAARPSGGAERADGAAQPEGGADAGHHVRQHGGQPAEGGVVQVSHGSGTLVRAGAHKGGAFRKVLEYDREVHLNDRVTLEHVHRVVLRVGEGSCGT